MREIRLMGHRAIFVLLVGSLDSVIAVVDLI